MANIRPTFAARNFISGQQVQFIVYRSDGSIQFQGFGTEWANTGVYYIDLDLSFGSLWWKKFYLIVAKEINGNWQAAKVFTKTDAF